MGTVQKTFRTDPRLQHLARNRPKSKGGRPPIVPPQSPQPGPSGSAGPGAHGARGEPTPAGQRAAIGNYIQDHPDEPDGYIAGRFGVDTAAVSNTRRDMHAGPGTSRGRPGSPPDQKNAMAQYMQQHPGESDRAVGERFGVSQQTVNSLRGGMGMRKSAGSGVVISPETTTGIVNYILQHPTAHTLDIADRFHVGGTSVGRIIRTDPRLQHLVGQRPGRGRPRLPEAPGSPAQPAQPAQPGHPSGEPEPQGELPARRQQAIDLIQGEVDRTAMSAVDSGRVIQWMLDNLSDEQLEAIERLPEHEFEQTVDNIRSRFDGGAGPAR
jgi:hypothetical protein